MDNGESRAKKGGEKIGTVRHLVREFVYVGATATAGLNDPMRKLSTRYAEIK